MSSSAGCSSLALHTDDQKESSDDRPACLENPRPAGAESTLTENVASPFQAEPRHPDKGTFKMNMENTAGAEAQLLFGPRTRPRKGRSSTVLVFLSCVLLAQVTLLRAQSPDSTGSNATKWPTHGWAKAAPA